MLIEKALTSEPEQLWDSVTYGFEEDEWWKKERNLGGG